METDDATLLTQHELAQRWQRSESEIGSSSAAGVGPRCIEVDGMLCYPLEEVRKYERACLFFEPATLALQGQRPDALSH